MEQLDWNQKSENIQILSDPDNFKKFINVLKNVLKDGF
jgi:acetone carboxylase gamma subunit